MKLELAMDSNEIFKVHINDGVPEITPDEYLKNKDGVLLVDVRRPDEFDGELAHIPGAQLAVLGAELDRFLATRSKSEIIVFVCRSGARSGQATRLSRDLGFLATYNLQGGMLLWNEKNFPTERTRRNENG